MKRLAVLLFAVATPALAVMGVLVSQSSQTVGGKFFTVCNYNVGGTIISRMIEGPAVCPPSINI